MSDERAAYLEQQLAALQAENHQLRQELEAMRQRAQAVAEVRGKVVRGGGKLLIPLLDRQRVVRSFSDLAQTVSEFSGPTSQWPTRDRVLGAAREFAESCVRFTIRRRVALWAFSLLASSIPIIQLWLVVQQNEIIENQNKFFEIQVYDVVSRSMTEGDRNAKLMTGALLSRADLDFLRGVIEEAFDRDLAGVLDLDDVHAVQRRLEDAAFRGYLMRAVVRAVDTRVDEVSERQLYDAVQPMLHSILLDAADRIPGVLRLGAKLGEVEPGLPEQVDNYLAQLGGVMRTYGRLARAVDDHDSFHAAMGAVLARTSTRSEASGRFAEPYRVGVESLLFELALQPELGDPPVSFDGAGMTPEQAVDKGLQSLRTALGDDAVDWDALAGQVAGR